MKYEVEIQESIASIAADLGLSVTIENKTVFENIE